MGLNVNEVSRKIEGGKEVKMKLGGQATFLSHLTRLAFT